MPKKCPNCLKDLPMSIDSKWKWICPECGHTNTENPGYYNCEKCHVSPKFALCPYCQNPIDLIELFFDSI